MKKWFLNKKKQLRLLFSRLVLKGYSKFIPFLRNLKIYSLDDIKEQTRGGNSAGVPYADGLIMNIYESFWNDDKVTVLFCHPNKGFVIKTVETELLVAGLVDFGIPKSSTQAWDRALETDTHIYGAIKKIGTFGYNNKEPIRLTGEEVNVLIEKIREEYKKRTEQ